MTLEVADANAGLLPAYYHRAHWFLPAKQARAIVTLSLAALQATPSGLTVPARRKSGCAMLAERRSRPCDRDRHERVSTAEAFGLRCRHP